MRFQIIERKFPEEEIAPEKCFYWKKDTYYKIDNPYFGAESMGDTIEEATINLMDEIESILAITIYVGLIAKEDTWFDAGTEALEYDCGHTRISLFEYKDFFHADSVTVRGIRTKESESESKNVKIGEKYFDGETCMLDEFEVYFTTDPIYTKGA
jgi:hypothetical protein